LVGSRKQLAGKEFERKPKSKTNRLLEVGMGNDSDCPNLRNREVKKEVVVERRPKSSHKGQPRGGVRLDSRTAWEKRRTFQRCGGAV